MRYFVLLLTLASCASERAAESIVPAEQMFTAAGLAGPPAPVVVLSGKYKGPVNITVQQGNDNTAGQTAIDKAKGPVASAPNAVASATREAGTAWYWFVLAAVGGAVGWDVVSQKLGPLKWLPWRARPG